MTIRLGLNQKLAGVIFPLEFPNNIENFSNNIEKFPNNIEEYQRKLKRH